MTETKHDTKLERDALVSQWQASGLKKVDFCRKHQIKVTSVRSFRRAIWLTKRLDGDYF